MNPIDNIQIDDLDGEQRQLAETIGIEAYRGLVKQYAGMHIYVPEHETFKNGQRNAQIRGEFDGYNFRDLARKYGLTESSIRRIVDDMREKIRKAPMDGQIDLFHRKFK